MVIGLPRNSAASLFDDRLRTRKVGWDRDAHLEFVKCARLLPFYRGGDDVTACDDETIVNCLDSELGLIKGELPPNSLQCKCPPCHLAV